MANRNRSTEEHDGLVRHTGPAATVYVCATCKTILHRAPAGFRSYADYSKARKLLRLHKGGHCNG